MSSLHSVSSFLPSSFFLLPSFLIHPSLPPLSTVYSTQVIPIPGSSSDERVKQNIASANIKLSKDEQSELDRLVKEAGAKGGRYPEQMSGLNWGTGKLE